jgi:hypothetical protein
MVRFTKRKYNELCEAFNNSPPVDLTIYDVADILGENIETVIKEFDFEDTNAIKQDDLLSQYYYHLKRFPFTIFAGCIVGIGLIELVLILVMIIKMIMN